jgi:cation transport regulator ChaB
MPYRTNQELPDSVKDNLPRHAQNIYREAFDYAWMNIRTRTSGGVTSRAKRLRTKLPGPQ